MIDNKCKISIEKQCKLLGVNRSSLYYSPKVESNENLEIMRLLGRQYLFTPFYGYRKMTVWLENQNYCVNEKRVRRLMKLVNWKTIFREPRTTICNKEHKKYPYLLKNLEITHKNQVWATDITYIPMQKGFMYMTAIMDVYSRKILSWGISNSMDAAWCKGVLQDAIDTYGTPEIINSDQGSQYTSALWTQFCEKMDIKISMDGKGRATDNAWIERFWKSLKNDYIYLNPSEDGIHLYQGVRQHIDYYHNKTHHTTKQKPEILYQQTVQKVA